VLPVASGLPPEAELYQLMLPEPVADNDKDPAPQRDAPAAEGAEGILLMAAVTGTRVLEHPAVLTTSA
jgi:hypothetical protein